MKNLLNSTITWSIPPLWSAVPVLVEQDKTRHLKLSFNRPLCGVPPNGSGGMGHARVEYIYHKFLSIIPIQFD